MTFLNWKDRIGAHQISTETERPSANQSAPIDVIDGDTVRFQGSVYRLAGFHTPERGDKPQSLLLLLCQIPQRPTCLSPAHYPPGPNTPRCFPIPAYPSLARLPS